MPPRNLSPLLLTILLCLIGGLSSSFCAAYVGDFELRATLPLSASQRDRLAELVQADAEAAALFAKLRTEAERRLDLKPRPLATLHYVGLVNTDPRRLATVEHLREMDDVAVLVQYWQAGGDPRAADTLRRFVLAWSSAYAPTGDDVNENKFYPLFVAYEALRDTFPDDRRLVVDSWIRCLGELHAESVSTSKIFTNRYTKHVRLLSLFGLILDRPDWRDSATVGLRRFVAGSLRADGTSLDLETRDTLTYHNSALRPVIELAVLAGSAGPALYTWTSPAGGSIKRSVDYVVPYASGEKTREEWRNTRVELDRQRAAAGLKEYSPGRLYEPKNALSLLEEASFFDPSLVPLVLNLRGSTATRFASWTMVINAACAPVTLCNPARHCRVDDALHAAAKDEFVDVVHAVDGAEFDAVLHRVSVGRNGEAKGAAGAVGGQNVTYEEGGIAVQAAVQ